jgi:hypothetical protein
MEPPTNATRGGIRVQGRGGGQPNLGEGGWGWGGQQPTQTVSVVIYI